MIYLFWLSSFDDEKLVYCPENDPDQPLQYTAQKTNFPLRIFSVNVTKSGGNCGFDHIY